MIDLNVSRELALALNNMFYVGTGLYENDLPEEDQDPDIKETTLNQLTQAFQNYGQAIVKEIKG